MSAFRSFVFDISFPALWDFFLSVFYVLFWRLEVRKRRVADVLCDLVCYRVQTLAVA